MSDSALLARPFKTVSPENTVKRSSGVRTAASASTDTAVWLSRTEWLTVALLTLVAALLHIRFVTEVGGLWRDETNSINIATLATFSDVRFFLDFDSFPILYFAVLRVWTGIFGVGNDEMLRLLGLLIGLSGLAALWANARAFGSRLPLLSLALVGLNPMIIRYGDSNRAYGLGILLILLTLRSFWQLVQDTPTARRIIVAGILAVLSVHCLYYNSVLLFAIAAGASAVALRARAWRTLLIVLGLGAVAAASLLPYAPVMIRMREWTFLVSYPATFSWLWERSSEVTGSPEPWVVWLWVGLVVLGLGLVVLKTKQAFKRHESDRLPSAILFAAVALSVGVVGYALFLRALNYYTQPWYYVTLAAFVACNLDVIWGVRPVNATIGRTALIFRGLRPTIAIALLCITVGLSWAEMPIRHTNIDLVAGQVSRLAREGDLILLPRWEYGIPFQRYYTGKAAAMTIPPIADHRFHRYDLVVAQMQTMDAMQPVRERMEGALRSGHRVIVIGQLPFETEEIPLPFYRPAYRDPNGGWHGAPYYQIWQAQAGRFLRAHAISIQWVEIPLAAGFPVQHFEILEPGVVVTSGWKE